MIKLKYKLFPQSFVNKIVKTIRLSENSEIAKSNLKNKFGLDDLEVKYILGYKLKYLIELVNTNNVRWFIRTLGTIHSLDGCIGLETITRILKENNISYKEYETTDYEYYNKKGSKLTSPTCDRIIIEITNPNHDQHLEIEIDKSLDSVVDLWFGSYWFEYYECRSEQEFINSYIDTIKDIMKDKIKVICYHSKTNNIWHASYCYYKDENSDIDDSEDLEKHMKLLDDNKIARWEIVFCYTWSELKIYNKKLGELK